jgi:hypothetical protein
MYKEKVEEVKTVKQRTLISQGRGTPRDEKWFGRGGSGGRGGEWGERYDGTYGGTKEKRRTHQRTEKKNKRKHKPEPTTLPTNIPSLTVIPQGNVAVQIMEESDKRNHVSVPSSPRANRYGWLWPVEKTILHTAVGGPYAPPALWS